MLLFYSPVTKGTACYKLGLEEFIIMKKCLSRFLSYRLSFLRWRSGLFVRENVTDFCGLNGLDKIQYFFIFCIVMRIEAFFCRDNRCISESCCTYGPYPGMMQTSVLNFMGQKSVWDGGTMVSAHHDNSLGQGYILRHNVPFLKTFRLALVSVSMSAALIHILTEFGRCRTAWAMTALAVSPGWKKYEYYKCVIFC